MKYTVLLYIDPNDPAFVFYSNISQEIDRGGKKLLWIETDDQPATDGSHYLHVKLRTPEGDGVTLWIPHHYVVMIGGDLDERKMGFVAKT